jgi:hypothetical protein
MRSSQFFIAIFLVASSFSMAQQNNDSIPDTSRVNLRYINPTPDISNEQFIDCERAKVFLYSDSAINDIVYLRKNFTDQFLQVCYNSRMYPASRIWGYNMNGAYFRSGHSYDVNYVFAERILTGFYSVYYCRNLPNIYGEIELISADPDNPGYRNRMIVEDAQSRRFKNDYSYFISPASDSAKMIYVNNKNIKSVAKDHFADCPLAYKDAMRFHNKYRLVQNITLPLGICSYIVSFLNFGGTGVKPFNIESPFLYVGLASIGTYIYFRIKAKNKYLHPNDMIRIVGTYNAYCTGGSGSF